MPPSDWPGRGLQPDRTSYSGGFLFSSVSFESQLKHKDKNIWSKDVWKKLTRQKLPSVQQWTGVQTPLNYNKSQIISRFYHFKSSTVKRRHDLISTTIIQQQFWLKLPASSASATCFSADANFPLFFFFLHGLRELNVSHNYRMITWLHCSSVKGGESSTKLQHALCRSILLHLCAKVLSLLLNDFSCRRTIATAEVDPWSWPDPTLNLILSHS